jgi:hypothetical protein
LRNKPNLLKAVCDNVLQALDSSACRSQTSTELNTCTQTGSDSFSDLGDKLSQLIISDESRQPGERHSARHPTWHYALVRAATLVSSPDRDTYNASQ